MPTVDYDEIIKKDLLNDDFAAGYLDDSIEMGGLDLFLIALSRVIKARGGFSEVAAKCNITREHLYKMVSGEGNPTLYNLAEVLEAVGLKLTIVPAVSASDGEVA